MNESVVTGESLPVEKGTKKAELRILLMGTSVVSGEATAVVVATGARTRIGTIAGRLQETEPISEFEKNLNEFSAFIFRVSLFLVLGIILLNIFFQNKNPFETFLFAVAIAVGITPELLPMIVTANLARGAIKMSRGGVIVKNLSAIHNFGSIDTLCTDKTGTLTEDRITLIKYVDGFGKENKDVLFWGSLSSYYVSGMRRTLDNAIREFHKFHPGEWRKLDEIPFDFERKMESVVVQKGTNIHLVVKGAPEQLVKISKTYGEREESLTAERKERVMQEYRVLSKEGYRVLGVGVKRVEDKGDLYTKSDEDDITFLGFLAFMDPPKHSAKETLRRMMRHNVSIKIITGDNDLVTQTIAHELNLPITGVLRGEEIEHLGGKRLRECVEAANLFSRVTPEQKELIVGALRMNGHVVGYLGDGVNDILALKAADVGISVNNAAQIAKETADIILMRKGLGEVIEGVVEGRKTFANTFKYLMMALSSDFGNMFSMPVASLFLKFLPMTPTQIILNNFIYDSSQFTIPFDNVDDEFLHTAKKFNMRFIKIFMLIFGTLSSFFDVVTFTVLYLVFQLQYANFQTGWFLESIATQTLVVNIIRSRGGAKSRPSAALFFGSIIVTIFAWILPYTPLGKVFGMAPLSLEIVCAILAIVALYLCAVEIVKRRFYRRWGHLIEA